MNEIHKFQLDGIESVIPAGRILKVDHQKRTMVAWVWRREGPDQTIRIEPTGATVDPNRWEFLDTFLVNDGEFVFHAFRKRVS